MVMMTTDLRPQLFDADQNAWMLLLLKCRWNLVFSSIDQTQIYTAVVVVVVEMFGRLYRASTASRTSSRWTWSRPVKTLRRHCRERSLSRRRQAVLLHKHQRTLYRHSLLKFSYHNFSSNQHLLLREIGTRTWDRLTSLNLSLNQKIKIQTQICSLKTKVGRERSECFCRMFFFFFKTS